MTDKLISAIGGLALATSVAWGGAASAAQTTCVPNWPTAAGSYASLAAANAAALQAAISQCSAAGSAGNPGLVLLSPSGGVSKVQITSVTLASNIVLYVASGFTLQAAGAADTGYSGNGTKSVPHIINGSNLTNVTIAGTGAIDGNGASYWSIYNQGGNYTKQSRPKLIAISGSNLNIGGNFTASGGNFSGVTFPTINNATAGTLIIRNGPSMNLAIESGSSNVLIDGVWIYAPTGRANLGTGNKKNVAPNTDGIDVIGTVGAVVRNGLIDVGDDDVAIKSNANSFTTDRVAISNLAIGGGHGLSIGGQEASGVTNVSANNIWFSGTDFGFKIKTDNSATDSGNTSGVAYGNSCMLNVGEPIDFTYAYNGTASGGIPPKVSRVTVLNLIATSAATPGQSAILGEVTGLVDDLMTDSIAIGQSQITGAGATPFTVTYGTLNLGTSSMIATATGAGGSIQGNGDRAPAISCPANFTIPLQS